MSASNFEACDRKRMKYEGGMSRDPNDPGNWTGGKVGAGELRGTNFGIAANTYPNIDIPNLTQKQAAAIFKRDYWDKVAGDSQPVGVDLCVYDTAVNSGVGRAHQFQKALLNTTNGYPSLARIAAQQGDYKTQVKEFCAKRMAFLRGLSTFGRYGKGWTSRVADVEATAIKMILQAEGQSSETVKKELNKEAAAAQKKAKTSGDAAAGTAAGGTAGGAGTAATNATSFDWTHWLVGGLIVLVVIGVIIFLTFKWYENRQRAKAYAAVALEG